MVVGWFGAGSVGPEVGIGVEVEARFGVGSRGRRLEGVDG